METMLLVMDGTEDGAGAADLAVRWAERFGAMIEVLGVIDEEAITAPEPASIGGDSFKQHRDETVLAHARQHMQAAMGAVVRRCHERNICCRALQRTGSAHHEAATAGQLHDLIIMPTVSHFALPGSEDNDGMLERLLAISPRPVVAVPPRASMGNGVLVACGDSPRSARALQAFVATGLHRCKPIWVLTVDAESESVARDQAASGADFLRSHGVHPQVRVVVSHEPVEEVIVDEANQLGLELIVIGAHRRSRFFGHFAASVTEGVVRHSSVPVFLSP